jgi:undecaprenyl-diphosphatase
MSYLHLFILAILQGITEFLPVSSSAHLAALPFLTDWQDQGVLIDVAVHVGTLFAVIIYFRVEVLQVLKGGLATLGVSEAPAVKAQKPLFMYVVVASLPVLLVGAILALAGQSAVFRDPFIIALATIGFGILLWIADKKGASVKDMKDLTVKSSFIIGLYQILALIPGTSRSGITMTAGRFLGFSRVEAARFSMLLSIPVILAAGTWSAYELAMEGADGAFSSALVTAFLSFLTALLAIHGLLKWLEKQSMTVFAIYRILFGGVLLYWVL